MWTKIGKVSLVLLLIGGFIYSIILGSANNWALWWIMPIGWVVTLFSAAPLGMLIEISEKLEARLETEYIQDDDLSQTNDISDVKGITDFYSSTPAAKRQKKEAHNAPDGEEDGWVCPQCGENNDYSNTKCSKCGWQA